MRIVLIYFLLFVFWAELALEFKLTNIRGFSLFNLSIYLLLFAWGVTVLTKKKLYESNNVNKYIIFLSLVVLYSILVKQLLGEIHYFNISRELVIFKKWVTPFILFFILANIIDDEKTLKGTALGLIILLAVTAITTPLMSIGILNVGHASTSFEGRASGFGGVNEFASYLVLFIPLVLTKVVFQKRFMHRVVSGVLLAIVLIALVTTGSRGGLISFLFAMAVYLVILKRQKMIRLPGIIAVFIAVLIISSISFALAPSAPKDILIERLDPTRLEEGEGMDKYTAGRTMLLLYGIQLFIESPIYGHGQNSFQQLIEKFGITAVAHNTYLSYLVEYGLIGLILFLMILIKIFQYAWKHLNETPNALDKQFYISYIAGLCGYHFSLLGLNEGQPRYIFWIYTAVLFKYSQFRLNR